MTTTTATSYGYKSDPGRRREMNEDSCAVLNHLQLNSKLDGLMIVADGLGGRRAGEVASSLLVETISQGVLEITEGRTRPLQTTDVEQLLLDTIVRANGRIMTQGRFQRREDTRGMATTCVAAILEDRYLTIGNVGDSRIYLQRGDEIQQLTVDHSEVFSEYVKGNLTEDEARNHRFRNQITRAVGLEANVRPDISTLMLEEGDTVLLCSDGLTTEIPDYSISNILAAAPTAQEACDLLVSSALKHGGRDNITVVVLRYGDFQPSGTLDDSLLALEEPDTDPHQNWRSESANSDDGDWDDDPAPARNEQKPVRVDPPAVLRTYRPGSLPALFAQFAPAIVGLLILCILVEAAMMYNMHRELANAPVTKPLPQDNHVLPSSSTPEYNAPVQLLDSPVLADILGLSANGNPMVASSDGQIQTYLVAEKRLLPAPSTVPGLPHTVVSGSKSGGGKPRADLFSDSTGALFYLNPDTRCIETYTATGTRTNQDLGKGLLKSPTRLVVSATGTIFVIDDHHLKAFTVKNVPKSVAHPSNADY